MVYYFKYGDRPHIFLLQHQALLLQTDEPEPPLVVPNNHHAMENSK